MSEKVLVGAIDEFPVQLGKEVTAGGRTLAVFRLTDGTFRAVTNACPHKQGPLAAGMVSGHHVFCPLHDRKINLDTGAVEAPDTGCTDTFDVVIQENQVYVIV